jgi:hypothetical protein
VTDEPPSPPRIGDHRFFRLSRFASLAAATGAVVFGGAGAILVIVLWASIFPELRRARAFAPQYRQREQIQ